MSAVKHNILIEQGSTFEITLVFKDCNGVLTDLTGSTFTSQIRAKAGDPSIIATFTCTVSDQVTNTGEMVMSMTAVETGAIPVPTQGGANKVLAKYAYDLEQLTPAAKTNRILEGVASVSPEVTT